MHIWTEEPQKELWRQLRYLTSPSNVYAILTGRTDSKRDIQFPEGPQTKKRAYQIASCLKQADQYHTASSIVGLVTRPLLDFYSCQALVKGVILSNNTEVDLSALSYHGLGTRFSSITDNEERAKAENYKENENLWKVESEYAVSNNGVFKYLCEMFDDAAIGNGLVLHFDDILRNTPDLAELYHRHYGTPSSCYKLSTYPVLNKENKLKIAFQRDSELELIQSAFPEFRVGYERTNRNGTPGFISEETYEDIPSWINVLGGSIAGHYLIRGLTCGIHQSAPILFSGLFIISNLVRYKPHFWMKEIEGERSGSASIVEAFCSLTRRKMPKDLLASFWKENFTFGAPGYLT